MPEEDDGNVAFDATCIGLDFTPIPGAGSLCDIANGIMHGNVGDIVSGGVFLIVDVFTFGQGHYLKGAGKAITKGTKAVSRLAKMVRQGKKILRGVRVNGKIFKSLRLAAK